MPSHVDGASTVYKQNGSIKSLEDPIAAIADRLARCDVDSVMPDLESAAFAWACGFCLGVAIVCMDCKTHDCVSIMGFLDSRDGAMGYG